MRLFVSLDVPSVAIAHLDRAVEVVRREHPQVRWVPAERWHVTLAFLGDVDDQVRERIDDRLAHAAARHPPLSLSFAGAGRFGSRVLWVGVRGDRDELTGLARSVAAGARRAGVAVDERVHRPHLTLARSRTASLDLRPLVAAFADYAGPTWRSTQVHLVRSYPGPEPRYETLRSWPLGG